MSSDDCTTHTGDGEAVGGGMSVPSRPDEVPSVGDVDGECWDAFDSFDDIG